MGDHADGSGGKIVYFAVDMASTQTAASQQAQDPSIGYMVYLGSDGKVWRVE